MIKAAKSKIKKVIKFKSQVHYLGSKFWYYLTFNFEKKEIYKASLLQIFMFIWLQIWENPYCFIYYYTRSKKFEINICVYPDTKRY